MKMKTYDLQHKYHLNEPSVLEARPKLRYSITRLAPREMACSEIEDRTSMKVSKCRASHILAKSNVYRQSKCQRVAIYWRVVELSVSTSVRGRSISEQTLDVLTFSRGNELGVVRR